MGEDKRLVYPKKIYIIIRAAGIISFIPFILLSGPIGGYLIGNYLKSRLGLGDWVLFTFICIGFIASFYETIRAVRLLIKSSRGNNG